MLGANHTGQMFMWNDFLLTINTNFRYEKFPHDSQKLCFDIDNKISNVLRFVVSKEAKIEAETSAKLSEPAGFKVDI